MLDEILARHTLRVCTTGDYKPYSFLKADGTFEGIDIDMADSLAKSLGVPAVATMPCQRLVRKESLPSSARGSSAADC